MNNLIIDAAGDKIFLVLMVNKNIYTCSYENSKNNYEKLILLINEFLVKLKITIDEIEVIYINRGPGSFAGIRNSLSIVKALFLTKKIDYYCFSFEDFIKSESNNYKDVPNLCKKFKIKKNLINPLYLS